MIEVTTITFACASRVRVGTRRSGAGGESNPTLKEQKRGRTEKGTSSRNHFSLREKQGRERSGAEFLPEVTFF
jgi:hypothetical protein